MQKELVTMPEIKLVGICVRTSNKQELDKMKGNIFPCVQKYFQHGLAEKISSRKRPGTTLCAYTNCETDFEVYDERAADDQNIVLDLYIGIEPC